MTKKEKNLRSSGLANLQASKKAFTLAEVLITLGIIGVVAAMTIPTLVANYQAKSWGTAATVFERKLEEALKTMNTQQSLAGYTTTEDFVAELSKHFKILKTCDNTKLTDCFSDTVYWGGGTATPEEVDMSVVKTSKNFGQNDWGTNIVGVQFANGTNALIAYNPITHSDDSTVKVCKQDPYSNQITGSDCLAILYDTSGYKSPNTSGKDLRANEHVKSLGSGCAFKIGETCYTTAPFFPDPMTYEECAGENATSAGTSTTAGTYAQSLGIKECYYANDYWAGAVKACDGVDKMPTNTQLTELADYLYDMKISSSSPKYCPTDDSGNYTTCRNTELALSLGFKNSSGTLTNSDTFWVFQGKENSANSANSRTFSSVYTEGFYNNWQYIQRNQGGVMTICIGD